MTTTITLTGTDRWAACSAAEFGHIGNVRHIVPAGGLTTVCGASATYPDIWRGNTTKPPCEACVTRYTKP